MMGEGGGGNDNNNIEKRVERRENVHLSKYFFKLSFPGNGRKNVAGSKEKNEKKNKGEVLLF